MSTILALRPNPQSVSGMYDASYGDNSGSYWLRVEKVQNIPPSSLTPINLLLISENQPIW